MFNSPEKGLHFCVMNDERNDKVFSSFAAMHYGSKLTSNHSLSHAESELESERASKRMSAAEHTSEASRASE